MPAMISDPTSCARRFHDSRAIALLLPVGPCANLLVSIFDAGHCAVKL